MHEDGQADSVTAIARAGDPDRALAALYAPREARADLFALYAFNVELARVAEQVREPDLGAIRLQWWRDALDAAARGKRSGHPVADAFADAMRRRELPRERIDALIDARQFDLGAPQIADWASLEAYLHDTAGTMFDLAARILGAPEDTGRETADEAGIAYGLTGLMRALPVHARQGRLYLSADRLERHGTSPDAVLAGRGGEGLKQSLAELRARARDALQRAEAHLAALPAPARTAYLPLSLVDPYLAALEKVAGDPLQKIAGINPLYRLWRMTARR